MAAEVHTHAGKLVHPFDSIGIPGTCGGRVRRQDRDRVRRPPDQLQRVRRGGDPARARSAGLRGAAGRSGGLHVPEHPGDAGGQLRRAARRRGAGAHQHPALRRGGPLHLRPLRREAAGGRHGVPAGAGPGAGHAADRRGGRGGQRPARAGRARRRPAREHLLRRVHEARLGGGAAVVGRRRVEPDLDQLHLGHDGHAEGRDVRPPRRLPERAGRDHPPAVRPGERLPVDAADVPLQRLVHAVGGHRDRRDARVPAGGARGRDLAALRRGAGDPSRRCPHRADDDRQRPAGPPARPRAGGDRGRRPARARR